MKTSIKEYAVYETRTIPAPEICGNCTKRLRGWFAISDNTYYGKNFDEASDKIMIRRQSIDNLEGIKR